MQSANRNPIVGDDALALLDGVSELWVAKGRRVEKFDLSGAPPGEAALRSAMVGSFTNLVDLLLGRSGKLRAPTLRVGDRLLVGYHREMFEEAFA